MIARIDDSIGKLTKTLLSMRDEKGMWKGNLSSSAISTAVGLFALAMMDSEKYITQIEEAVDWLEKDMKYNGSWGDSPESPPNLSATLLAYTALEYVGRAPEKTREFLRMQFGDLDEKSIVRGVLQYYGRDFTFSMPILSMCALSGIISSWDSIPILPYHLAALPSKFFRFLKLPVVSYALPALIAVGVLRDKMGRHTLFSRYRSLFIPKCMKVLERMQPEDGGFLEAAPLTAFVLMCLCAAGMKENEVCRKAADFLSANIRKDGSLPIDTNLANWVSFLSIKALGDDIPDKELTIRTIKDRSIKIVHPFTQAAPGGWGWTDLSGSVPDCDDTPGALIALHTLTHGAPCPEAKDGVKWILGLQNSDGGQPTFCRGWMRLPFDLSTPDLTAHSLLAVDLWKDRFDGNFCKKCMKAQKRMIGYLRRNQGEEGQWDPLWFGCQDTHSGKGPVYGTAIVVEYLSHFARNNPSLREEVAGMSSHARHFLLSCQNPDGGWGGAKGTPSLVTTTAKAVGALASAGVEKEAVEGGVNYLLRRIEDGSFLESEPIGLYFALLWYSEEMYNLTFTLDALKKARAFLEKA